MYSEKAEEMRDRRCAGMQEIGLDQDGVEQLVGSNVVALADYPTRRLLHLCG